MNVRQFVFWLVVIVLLTWYGLTHTAQGAEPGAVIGVPVDVTGTFPSCTSGQVLRADMTCAAPAGLVITTDPPKYITFATAPSRAFVSFGPTNPPNISFCGDGSHCVVIEANGHVTYKGSPDKAARAFWQAVEKLYPRCTK